MATSGFSDFAVSGTDIVRSALSKIRAVQEGGAASPEQSRDGLASLNSLIKFIAAKGGRNLWRPC